MVDRRTRAALIALVVACSSAPPPRGPPPPPARIRDRAVLDDLAAVFAEDWAGAWIGTSNWEREYFYEIETSA